MKFVILVVLSGLMFVACSTKDVESKVDLKDSSVVKDTLKLDTLKVADDSLKVA